jgi:16S rRNA G966 N2-methylase RsmD
MLNDSWRNKFYVDALQKHAKDKIVVDMGTGTGILAYYALLFGAKFVYCFEYSPEMALVAQSVLEKKFSKDRFKVIASNFWNTNLDEITNIKNIYLSVTQLMRPNEIICNKLVDVILNIDELNLYNMREHLYDIFIYNLDPYECIWFIINKLISLKRLEGKHMTDVLIKSYTFLQYYNNNYRPIYHFENFILYLMQKVHGL